MPRPGSPSGGSGGGGGHNRISLTHLIQQAHDNGGAAPIQGVGRAGAAQARKRAARAARLRFKDKAGPLPVERGGFRVLDWGALRPDGPAAFATAEHLFPAGLKVAVWHRHGNVAGMPRGVLVEYVTEVSAVGQGAACRPAFTVYAASSLVAATAPAPTPAAAWKALVRPPRGGGGKGGSAGAEAQGLSPGVRLTCRRLRRCQAVLNWVAYRPGAGAHLWLPVDETAFPTYRAAVGRPVCLEDVQRRLSAQVGSGGGGSERRRC